MARTKLNSKRKRSIHATLIARDGSACVWCGSELTEDTATLDHLLVQAHGGRDLVANLVRACFRCNNLRGSMPAPEFLRLCEQSPNMQPNRGAISRAEVRLRKRLRKQPDAAARITASAVARPRRSRRGRRRSPARLTAVAA